MRRVRPVRLLNAHPRRPLANGQAVRRLEPGIWFLPENLMNSELRQAIASTLDALASMLDREHAALAKRVRRAHDDLVDDHSPEVPDTTVRRLRRLMTGTMGGMSDVTLGALVDGRWVPDDARERHFRDLSRELGDRLSSLPPSSPAKLYLVTDRVREAWLIDGGSDGKDGRKVEVQPPIWTPTMTSEFVFLRGGIDDGDEVEITVEQGSGPSGDPAGASGRRVIQLGRGRVFARRDAAEAALR
jgi:hypothetical protein